MSTIQHTVAWPLPPAPPEMEGVPFELVHVPGAVPLIAARYGAVLGVPGLAALGPQIVAGVVFMFGTSGIRHGYRVLVTREERRQRHGSALDAWRSNFPPARRLVAADLAELKAHAERFRRGENGPGTTITLSEPFGSEIAAAFGAACDVMKRHDGFASLKRLATLLNEMRKVSLVAFDTALSPSKLILSINSLRKEYMAIRKQYKNEFWDDVKFRSTRHAELMLEFTANGAFVEDREGTYVISYGEHTPVFRRPHG